MVAPNFSLGVNLYFRIVRQAVALAPSSDDAYRRLGRAYLESDTKKEEALRAFDTAVKINPYKTSVDVLERLKARSPEALTMEPRSLLNWSNPERGTAAGAVFPAIR